MNDRSRVYVSIPVDMLTREQMEKLQAEVAGVLDPATQEPVFNKAVFDAPEGEPLRLWWHMSEAMLRLGKCDAVIFLPAGTASGGSAPSNSRRLSALASGASTPGATAPALCDFWRWATAEGRKLLGRTNDDGRTQVGAEVHPHGISRAGGLRRREHRAGVR